jgi:HPt (histidine-containing phosphotransfer) domain-containing protein
MFFTRAGQHIENCRDGLVRNDIVSIQSALHSMIGSAANLGVAGVAEGCTSLLECVGDTTAPQIYSARLNDIENQLSDAQRQLELYLRTI